MLQMLLSLCLSFLSGYFLVLILLPQEKGMGSQHLMAICLGLVLGFGVSSAWFFICYLLLAPATFSILAADFSIHLVSIALLVLVLKTREIRGVQTSNYRSVLGIFKDEGRLSTTFALMCLICSGTFVLIALQVPYGGHDALGVWNLRARILALPQDTWLNDLQTAGNHPDYPLLLGGIIGRVWMYAGHTGIVVPVTIHFLITCATVFLLAAAVWRISNLRLGILAGMILMGTPFFFRDGAEAQQADILMSFWVLSTMALLAWKDLSGKDISGLSTLAGLSAGLAAWSKNEGLLFLLCVVVLRFCLKFYFFGLKQTLKEMGYFASGVAPVMIVLVCFKTKITVSNDLFIGQGMDATISRLTDLSRHLTVTAYFLKEMLSFNRWQIYPFALGMYLFFSGIDIDGNNKKMAFFSIAGVIIMMLTGYYIIYLTTYLDLFYHLRTSFHRLLLHLWPLSLFAVFLIKKDSERYFAGKQG